MSSVPPPPPPPPQGNLIDSTPGSMEHVLRRFDELAEATSSSSKRGRPCGNYHNNNHNNAALQQQEEMDLLDSCMTAPTETGSISEDESTGWLGGITADIKTLAVTLKDTAGGVANFVQKSALAVATEIAHLEEEERAQRMAASSFDHCEEYDCETAPLHLPWEVHCTNGQLEADAALKLKIHALATKESTFLEPYSADDEVQFSTLTTTTRTTTTMATASSPRQQQHVRPPFALDEPRIELVRRILNLDEKLASMHARLSARSGVKEAVFWQNYFYNCELAREEHFVLHPLAESTEFVPTSERNDDDDDELTECDDEEEEDGSFIEIPTPPESQRSIGSIVVISGDNLIIPN
mmetsp:Transcript_20089/g.55486  ORF Transcript_20089/g.55486 Transcript_20089/m.55486 type:complete len:353 (-) Transcript_20089:262-1320(-)